MIYRGGGEEDRRDDTRKMKKIERKKKKNKNKTIVGRKCSDRRDRKWYLGVYSARLSPEDDRPEREAVDYRSRWQIVLVHPKRFP